MVHYPIDRIANKILSDAVTKHHPDAKALVSGTSSTVDKTDAQKLSKMGSDKSTTEWSSKNDFSNPLQELLNAFKTKKIS